jgi:tetratricopeptide (TPR) repeat protein
MDSQSLELDPPGATRRGPFHRRGWLAAAMIVGLLALVVTGMAWDSRRPENCYRRGRLALETGDRHSVIRESRRLIETPGFEPQGRLLSGLVCIWDQRPEEALVELQKAARAETTRVEALTAVSQCYYLLGRYLEAIDTARTVLEEDPEKLDARRWLAAALYDLGLTADAVAELKTISSKAPHDPRPDRLLGLIEKDEERFAEAIGHYRESLRRDSDQADGPTILLELAESLVKLSRFDEARETLRECEQTATALTLEADCLQNQDQTDAAEKRYREALAIDPQYLPARLNLGMLLLLKTRTEDAAVVLEEAVRLAPYSSQAHFQLSRVYARQGVREKAEVQLRLMREARASERQFTDLHEAAAQNPNDPDVRYRLGIMARQLGKPDLARMWFRAALSIQPDHAGARAALDDADTR